MNPTAPPPPLPPQPPQPPPLQPHRSSTSCNRHPEENFTGFCPSCLCERLAVLDPNNNNNNNNTPSSSSARKSTSSTAAAALKAVFRPPSSSFFPELRRTKSFSASKNEALSGVFEPQRKSCDVKVRGALFNQDERKILKKEAHSEAVSKNLASSSTLKGGTLVQSKKEEEEEEEEEEKEKFEEDYIYEEEEDEIRVVEEPNVCHVSHEIIVDEKEQELKTMKDHIDLDSSQTKKTRGSFWSAASVFSKKLQKWRQKQKEAKKRHRNGSLPVEKPIRRQFRDTQSEFADYGYGRRSCDVDPRFSLDAGRFSLDAGRMSFDDPRYSLDEPRASWDGYLIGRTGFPRMPTMLSVVEDAPVNNNVVRTDTQIPVEEPMNMNTNEDDSVPGGSAQTRDYYSDSSSRRRKSLDRSNSVKKKEIDELKSVSNGNANGFNVVNSTKVTPSAVDYIHGVRTGLDYSARDDCCSETYDMGGSVIGNGERKGAKKSRRWSIWSFIYQRGRNKDEDEDRYSRVNGVERSFSESWSGDGRGGFGGRVLRSNSSVSWRNAQGIGSIGSFGSSTLKRNGIVQGDGHGKKGKDEFVLERNKSARYSPNDVDNGVLRLYLTPMRGGRRNGSVKNRSNQAHYSARNVLGLY